MFESVVAAALTATALVYAVGVSRLWSVAGTGRIVQPTQLLAFSVAYAVLLAALLGPLEHAADTELAWHMVQHVPLLAVVPPLLALSAPATVALYALPVRWRHRLQPTWRKVLRSQQNRHWLTWTAASFALATTTLAVWHVPAFYDAAVTDHGLHALEHLSFVATATLFWWMVLGAGRHSRQGAGVLCVFVATLPATALGVLMTLAATSWYAPYGRGPAAVRGQQIAGAVMWGFGGLGLTIGAATLFAGWLAHLDRGADPAGHETPLGA